MATYYLSLTDHGAAALAAAQAGGPSIQISHLVLGDANGQPYQPSSATSRTTLVHQLASLPVLSVTAVDDLVTVDTLVPASVGGFAIHEIGLTDAAGQLLYIGNWTGGYKPVLAEGGAGDMQFRLELLTSGLPTVVIVSDPNNVTATRQWALDHFVLQTVFDAHVTQNALEHDNLLALIQAASNFWGQQLAAHLAQPPIPPIKVGGLLLTTNNYEDSAAVTAGEGYGTWERLPGGFALTTIVPPSVPTEGIPPQLYDMLDTVGEYEHTLTIDEMPIHKHSTAPYDKFTVRSDDAEAAGDTYDAGGGGYGLTVTTGDLNHGDTEIQVADISAGQWAKMTESDRGGDQPFSIVQPSIVIGAWRRTA